MKLSIKRTLSLLLVLVMLVGLLPVVALADDPSGDSTELTISFQNTSGSPASSRIVKLIANEAINSPGDGWTVVENSGEKEWTKEFTSNTKVTITVTSTDGQKTASALLDVKNIDSSSPTGTVTYSTTAPTNQDVTVTLTTSTDCNTPDGWTKVDWRTFTKVYTENGTETVALTSRTNVKGQTPVSVSVQNIDCVVPTIDLTSGETYCVGKEFTVADADSGVATVKINNSKVSDYKLPDTASENVTIIVTDRAGNSTTITVNVVAHKWDDGVVTTPATCGKEGVKTYTCTVCGDTKTEAITPTANAHKLTHVSGKAATCNTAGYQPYYKCDNCGKLFSDKDGKNPIDAPVAISATGKHTSSSWKVGRYPTEKRNGFMYKECTVCGTQLDTMVLTWRDVKPTLPFVDVDSKDSYYDAVCYVYDKGLMKGTSDTRFSPNRTFDRAMVAMILYRMEGRPSVKYNSVFPDVGKNDWYADCISWAYKYGVLKGYDDGTVRPEDAVTVEQLLTILYRYADSEGYDVSGRGSVNRYYDADDISAYALKAVRWAVSEDLISGRGYLGPKSNATRAEVAEILTNFCKNVLKYK